MYLKRSCFKYVALFGFCGLLLGVLGPAEVQGYQLPDTGQTTCYDDNGNVITNCPPPQGRLSTARTRNIRGLNLPIGTTGTER